MMMFYLFQTIVITLMFYSSTKNHYIAKQPLPSCLMAKICNHTGIEMCGLEKDQRDMRLFLDDCDMFEYNCDYKTAYSKVDDKLCEDIVESNTENPNTSTSVMEESTSVNDSSQTTTHDKHTNPNATNLEITTTQTKPEIITIPPESMTSDSRITTNNSETTVAVPITESQNVNESIKGSTYANISRITIDDKSTPGNQNSTSIATSEKQNTGNITKSKSNSTDTVISDQNKKRCTCMDSEILIKSSHLEHNSSTIQINFERESTTSSSIPKIIQSRTETVNTLAQTKSLETYETMTITTQPESENITKSIKPMSSVFEGTHNLQTVPMPTAESTFTSNQVKHECTCTHSHSEPSSMKTASDKITETTLNHSETTAVQRVSEFPNVTKTTTASTYVNVPRIPIASECTRGKQNSTSITSSEKQNTESVTKSTQTINNYINTLISSGTKRGCTCMDTKITTGLSHLETYSTTTPTYLETKESTTEPITKTQINTEILSTSTQAKSCTCNSVNLKKQSDEQTIAVPTTESTITTINDEVIHTPLNKDESLSNTLTTVEYKDVITTIKHSCDNYPKHCKRPLTWETTARGETRDFFQILRERFGDRVKILRDTTHWPRKSAKPIENDNDAFHFGIHNEG